MGRLVSDWEVAPASERRKVRILAIVLVAMVIGDVAFWWFAL